MSELNTVLEMQDMKKVSAKQKVGKVFSQIGLYLFLGIMALTVLFPFYWMLVSSLMKTDTYYAAEISLWPKEFYWQNYVTAFNTANLARLFLNTLFVGLVSTVLSLVITILAAFAFARLEFKGKNIIFGFMLATMMIPGELFTITNYQTMVSFHWMPEYGALPTFTAMIVPFLVSVFYIYLLKQNFEQIPNELYLAAKVDGTSDFKYLCKVMIPLALPTLISITILKMMGAWNTYVWPRLISPLNEEYWLVTLGIRQFTAVDEANRANIPAQMAAVTLVSIPLFLVFVFLRKYIMKGVSRSGIKG